MWCQVGSLPFWRWSRSGGWFSSGCARRGRGVGKIVESKSLDFLFAFLGIFGMMLIAVLWVLFGPRSPEMFYASAFMVGGFGLGWFALFTVRIICRVSVR